VAASLLSQFTEHPGHSFWPDDISVLDGSRFDLVRLATSNQVTDGYLLALAVAHGGKLATFDRRLIPDFVLGGAQRLHLIGSP
jgi:predicted nucleic acid-binding protein